MNNLPFEHQAHMSVDLSKGVLSSVAQGAVNRIPEGALLSGGFDPDR